jgi:hypothetical protein
MGRFSWADFHGQIFMGMSWYLERSCGTYRLDRMLVAGLPAGTKADLTAGPGIENRATKNRFVKLLETSTRPPESGMFGDGAGRT